MVPYENDVGLGTRGDITVQRSGINKLSVLPGRYFLLQSSISIMSSSSIVIIGAGIFGTSTAYHLSLTHPSPSQITVVDRTPFPPTHGASTDINKIIRSDYSSPFYMDLAYDAIAAWKSSPIISKYYHNSGWISLQKQDSDLGDRIRATFRARGVDPTSDVSLEECRKRWGECLKNADFEGLKGGYWNPEAGWADAGAAVGAMMSSAVERGVKYVCGDAESLLLDEKGVRGVRLKSGEEYEADKVLLCTGAWTSALMSDVEDELGLEEDWRMEKQTTAAGVCCAHFRLTDEEMEKLREMSVVIYSDKGEFIPPPRIEGAGPNGKNLLKFTNAESFTRYVMTKSGRKISVPPDQDQTIVPERLKEETLNEMVRKVMPQYSDRRVEYFRLCWDAITPDQNQLITEHPYPRLNNLYLAVGGSFHSWKFLPTIGEYVVNMLDGKGNGGEKDAAWSWKINTTLRKGAHEKVIPKRDLRDLEND